MRHWVPVAALFAALLVQGDAFAASTWTTPAPLTAADTVADDRVLALFASTGLPSGGATYIGPGGGEAIAASDHLPGTAGWTAPVPIADDYAYSEIVVDAEPAVAASPTGEVTAAWPAWDSTSPNDRTFVEVAVRSALGKPWSTPTRISATGDYVVDVHVAYGSDGTAVVAWRTDAAVFAAVREPGGAWGVAQRISGPVDSPTIPDVSNLRLAVTKAGLAVVLWSEYAGTQDLNRYDGLRSAILSKGGSWSSLAWLAPTVVSSQVVAGGDGAVTAWWRDIDGGNWTSTLTAGAWTAPEAFPGYLQGGTSIVSDASGRLTAAWVGGAWNAESVEVSTRTPGGTWSPARPADPGYGSLSLTWPIVTVDDRGMVTLTWSEYLDAPAATWRLVSSTVSPTGTISAPVPIAAGIPDPRAFQVVEDACGSRAVLTYSQVHRRVEAIAEAAVLLPAGKPTITGVPAVGRTLRASTGLWAGGPSSYTYVWRRDGAIIKSAGSATYTPTIADAGKKLTVTVTARRTSCSAEGPQSTATTIPRPPLVVLASPTISGRHKVGRTLVAHAGSWSPQPTSFSYRWLRNGKPIGWATKSKYKLTKADRGKRIAVRVTARKAPYAPNSVASKAVRAK